MTLAVDVLSGEYFLWWGAQLIAIAILVWAFLRWRPGFLGGKTIGNTLGAALDARENQIRVQLEAAERSRQEAARIQAEARQEIEQARAQAAEIVQRTQQTSESIQREIEARGEEEGKRIVAQAKEEIEYERRQAEMALRRRAADIVVDAAAQIIGQNLSPEADRRIVADSLANFREVS